MFISKLLARKVSNYSNENSLGVKLRARRVDPLLEMVKEVHKQKGQVEIIDIGGTDTYWKIIPSSFLSEHNVQITIINIPGVITPEDYGHFVFKQGNGCNMKEFSDYSFDIVHSNSVIEHVGEWSEMTKFASEVHRLASKHFVQTPNYWFPIEPHCMTLFYHWLPKPLRVWLIMRFSLGNWKKRTNIDAAVKAVDSARLLNNKMFSYLFPSSTIVNEKVVLLIKSFIAIKK